MLPYEPQADRVPDPTRRRPFIFRRGPAQPGARMGPNGRPRDFGFIREQLGRLTRPMQPGGPVAPGAADGEQFVRPMRPPVGPILGAASEMAAGFQPPQPAPTDRLPGWQNIQAGAGKMLPGPAPDGAPQPDQAAEELKKRFAETDTGLPPGQMF